MKKKEDAVDDLLEAISNLERESADRLEKTKEYYENELNKVSEERNETVISKTSRLRQLEDEMKALAEFKLFKDELEKDLRMSHAEYSSLKRDNEEELVRLERRKLEEKARIQKEMEDKLQQIKVR
jgi:hypothetical protein